VKRAPAVEAQSVNAFLGGLVSLVQPLTGHRAGLDAALLQALVPAAATGQAIDLGAGVGTVAFALAARAPALAVTGIERDPALVALGLQALQLPENAGFAARVRLIEADATARRVLHDRFELIDNAADWVLMNPPFDTTGRVRESPNERRRGAHVAPPGLLDSWCRTAAALLKPGGFLGLIHRAESLPEILPALAGRFGDIRVLPVHASGDAAAIRILVRARRGSRARLSLVPGLVLHQPDGGWTAEADAILRGRAELHL
jgi:tRNA1(Val) A37 N6-methylase TrmN6